MAYFPVVHRITVFSGASNTVPLFTVASRPGVYVGNAGPSPGAWWRGDEGRWTDLAKTVPALLVTDRVRAWAEDTYTLTQPSADAADSPLYSPEAMEQPSLNFNARPWLYSSEAGLLTPVSGSDVPWSVLVALTIPAGALAERYVFSLRDGSGLSGALHTIGVAVTGGNLHWRAIRRGNTGAGVTVDGDTISTATATTYILTYRFDGTACELRANGQIVLSGAMNLGAFTPTALVVGAIDDTGDFEWSGFVAHVLYFLSRITDPSVTYWEAQLGALFPSTGILGTAYPYLFPPALTPRRIQVPECTGDPGQLRFRVLDKRATPGDQQDRVITALLSDSEGRLATRNSLAAYDVSDDDGATYQREFTGRVHEVSLVDKNTLAFSVDDPSVDALFETFDGTVPTVPWALPPVFSPVGLVSPDSLVRYGPHTMVQPLPGKVQIDAGIPAYVVPTFGPPVDVGPFTVPLPVQDYYLIVTDALQEAASYTAANPGYLLGRYAPDLRVAFRPTGSTEYLHFSAAVIYNPIEALFSTGYTVDHYAIRVDGEGRLDAVGIVDLTGGVAIPANGTTGSFYVYGAAPPKPSAPLHIGYTVPDAPVTTDGIHWAVLVSGVAHGAFGGRGVTIDYPRFNAIIQDETQPKLRFRVMEGPVDALGWLQENVWPVVGFAPGVTASGGLYPVSYDPPAVLPSLVFDASNVEEASWAQGRTGQFNRILIDTMRERQSPPQIADVTSPTDMLKEFEGDRIDRYRDLGAKLKPFQITAKGVRRADDGDGFDKSRQYMIGRADSILDRFQDGPQTLDLIARRTPATKGALVGDHALEAIPWVPDLETGRRGGTRIMLVVSKGVLPDGRYSFELLDNGPSQFVDAPTIDAVALNAANTKHIVDVTITPPGEGDRAALEVATTPEGDVAPAAGSELWMHVASVEGGAQQVVTIPNLASRRSHHFRAIGRGAGKLPSAYSAVESITTDAIDPPTDVVAASVGASVLMTWTNGDATYAVMPVVSLDVAEVPVEPFLPAPLPAGSTRVLLTELGDPGDIRVGVKHVDDFGGDSLVAEADATIGDTPTTLAAPIGLTVLQGRTEDETSSPRDMGLGIGVELQWTVTEPYATTVVEYADEDTFAAPVVVAGIATDRVRILFPLTDTVWYFRAFHERAGFTTSVATETAVAKAVPLVLDGTVNDGFAGGYAYLSVDQAQHVFLNVGSADPDADRFYYEVSAAGFVEPTIASPFVDRAAFPYSADTGVVLQGAAYLWGKFWSATKGFGQGVKHSLGSGTGLPLVATIALQEVVDDGRKVNVAATFTGAASWRAWERDGGGWPTNDGTQTGAPDDAYQRFTGAIDKPSYRRTIADSATRNVVAQAFTAANVGGPRVTASITVGAGSAGSEDGVMYGFAYVPGASFLELGWYFNEPIETPVPDPRWSVKVYQGFQGMDTLVSTRDPRTDGAGGMGTAYQGGFRDVTFAHNLDGEFCQILYRFVLSDNQAAYPDVEYQLPVSDFFDVSL